jgi:hypothetical protein
MSRSETTNGMTGCWYNLLSGLCHGGRIQADMMAAGARAERRLSRPDVCQTMKPSGGSTVYADLPGRWTRGSRDADPTSTNPSPGSLAGVSSQLTRCFMAWVRMVAISRLRSMGLVR